MCPANWGNLLIYGLSSKSGSPFHPCLICPTIWGHPSFHGGRFNLSIKLGPPFHGRFNLSSKLGSPFHKRFNLSSKLGSPFDMWFAK